MNHANDNLISAQANVSRANVKRPWRGRSQNHHGVRFWIITMMLVLVGLSTLKLR
jgi:UDP-N-acetylmuramyl pentapeptide phosphotransferase/UDP-N-acetylglucosamine-1-phosphate transferase